MSELDGNDRPDENASVDQEHFVELAEQPDVSFARELFAFLRQRKAWWMIPILASFVLVLVTAWLSASPLAPFIYPLF